MPQPYYPLTLVVTPGSSEEALLQQVQKMFQAPFVVKPDVGMMGILFRKIENTDQLLQYHRRMTAPYLVQAFVPYPQEVSVFYCRLPSHKQGKITAVIQKNLLQVTGNGKDTVLQLLQQAEGAAAFLPAIQRQQGRQLETVLPPGQVHCLSNVGNRMNGATFVDLTALVDDDLLRLFDEISLPGQFCYGRYDIKCQSLESLKKGRDFLILEFNGAGSIPNHIYTPGVTLWRAWREVALHWQWLYRISKIHHQKGVPYWSFSKGLRFLRQAKRHFKQLKELDKEMVLH